MRTLEKGFGDCSLRTSTFISLGVLVVIGLLIIFGLFTGTVIGDQGFVAKVCSFIYEVPLTALFGYTFYTLYRDEPSTLQWAWIALCVDVVVTVLGLLLSVLTFFTHFINLIISLIVLLPLIAFKAYSAWIMYSYWIEFKPAVTVTA